MAESDQADLTTLTVELLSAFVSNNSIESSDLAGLIQSTHSALTAINAPAPVEPPAPEFEPAVTVRKSLASRDHILSLIDGKPYKTLKRHLSGHGLTPAQYRERYKLPGDYPMVAPTYSDHRRNVAQRLGLGRKPAKIAEPETSSAAEPPVAAVEAPPVAPKVKKPAAKSVAPAKSAKTAKPATKRAAKASAPAPALVETPPAADPVETNAPPPAATPKTVRKAATPKSAKTKTKPSAPADAEAKPKTAAAKRGRPKAAVASPPTE